MLRKIFTYEEFSINENASDTMASTVVREVFDKILKSNVDSNKYEQILDKEYDGELAFELSVKIKRDSSPDFQTDAEFEKLPWEEFNYQDHGFSLDANTFLPNGEDEIALVEVIVLINPDREPELHKELYHKLQDTISHELYHVSQYDSDEELGELKRNPSKRKRREEADNSYEYFLLDDEIPAMVHGMNRRAVIEKRPLDHVFIDYFEPFLRHGFMNKEQFEKVMKVYIEYATKNIPGAEFSNKAKTF